MQSDRDENLPVATGSAQSSPVDGSRLESPTLDYRQIRLIPARPDPQSPKVQMIAAGLAASLLCFVVYSPALSVGFLLDDFLHIEYIAKALKGDWAPFLSNLTGNWAGSDLMKSYRPLVSLSLLLDAAAGGLKPYLFHATNIVLLCACSILTGLTALELTGLKGNRLGGTAAVWSALLFAVYPLHTESVAWIIGRVDLLCTFFYLGSLWSHLRFRLLREPAYFKMSLASFACAMLSKEMAVTLPVVIAAAEVLLLPGQDKSLPQTVRANRLVQRFSYVCTFFFVLGFFAGLRLLLLGTLVGGYGADAAGPGLFALLDRATLLKIFFPIHEELNIAAFVVPALSTGLLCAAATLLLRLAARSVCLRTLGFVLIWCVIACLPAYQIWHIWPNLVGSRLFFNGSAPFCILLVLMALPAIDTLKRKLVLPVTAAGVLGLSLILVSWAVLAGDSLTPWLQAERQMKQLQSHALHELSLSSPGQRILFLNLPTDYCGAGMVTREQYLKLICQPPFSSANYADKIATIEPPVSGSHEFVWPNRFKRLLAEPSTSGVLVWSPGKGDFLQYRNPTGEQYLKLPLRQSTCAALKISPQDIKLAAEGLWKQVDQRYCLVEAGEHCLRIRPGKQRLSLSWPERTAGVNPLSCDFLKIKLTGCSEANLRNKLSVQWAAFDTGDSSSTSLHSAPLTVSPDGSSASLWLGRYRSWLLSGSPSSLRLDFQPGDYEVELHELVLMPSSTVTPKIAWSKQNNNEEAVFLEYDTLTADSTTCKILVTTEPNRTFDAGSPLEIQAATTGHTGKVKEIPCRGGKGSVRLLKEWFDRPGLYQARVLIGNPGDHQPCLPGEPLTFRVHADESGGRHFFINEP